MLQHLALLFQGGAAPEPIGEFANADVLAFEFLLLLGAKGGLAGASPQRGGYGCRRQKHGLRRLGGQLHPAALVDELCQRGQLHGDAIQLSCLQLLPQP